MKIKELIQVLDHDEWMQKMVEAVKRGLSDDDIDRIIRERSKWLWETYKPSEEVMAWHRKTYGGKKEWP